jgi:hypothetical protein
MGRWNEGLLVLFDIYGALQPNIIVTGNGKYYQIYWQIHMYMSDTYTYLIYILKYNMHTYKYSHER